MGFSLVIPPPPPGTRRYAGGHYIAWPTPLGAAGIPNGGTVTGTYPNAVVTGALASNAGPAVRSSANGQTGSLVTAGFMIRHNWNEIEPTAGSFNYAACDKQLAQARALGVPMAIMIVVRTFDGTTPPGGANPPTNTLPADLATPFSGAPYGYADLFSTGASGSLRYGFQVWRWSPTIRSRYNNLCTKLGTRYNADIYFAGMATQETASGSPTGGSSTVYSVGAYSGQDAYTSSGFLTGLDDENDSISTQCPNGRGFPYQNFMQGPFPSGQNAQSMILQYGTHVQPNGSWFGCPDLVTGASGNSNIVNNVYPNLQKFHNGTSPIPAPGPTFAAVQHGEWAGTGVGDTPPNMPNLFNYATSSFSCKPADGFTGALDWSGSAGRTSLLNVDGLMWDYVPSGSPNFTTNLVPIMKAFPLFGTFSP